MVSLIANFCTRWRWVFCFTFRLLYPRGKFPVAYWIWGCVGHREGPDVVDWRKL